MFRLFLLIFFISFCVSFLISLTIYEKYYDTKRYNNALLDFESNTPLLGNNSRVNCSTDMRLCSSDIDCNASCIAHTDGAYTCVKQLCVLATDFEQAPPENQNCNEKHGIHFLLNADGEFHCVSLNSYLYDNNDRQQDYACKNGNLDVNVLEHPTSVHSCHCSPGLTLMSHVDTPHIPRCYPASVLNLNEYNN